MSDKKGSLPMINAHRAPSQTEAPPADRPLIDRPQADQPQDDGPLSHRPQDDGPPIGLSQFGQPQLDLSQFDLLRETYIQIDLDRIAHNMNAIRQMCGPATKIGAVVKADAYGHGALGIADTLLQNGADLLCVATLSEAVELKLQDPLYPVLIMGLTMPCYLPYLLKYDILQTIDTIAQAKELDALAARSGKKARIHIKVDTGFHRLGFVPTEEALEEIAAICRMDHLSVEGIFTHLVLLDDASNEQQAQAFAQVRAALEGKGISIPCWHMADSIASVDYPPYRLDMIRAGAIIYGLKGFHKGSLDIRQALTFKTRISHITQVRAGEGVGYDFTWRADQDTRIATLPFGYADGYPRSLNHKGLVTLHGKRVPVIGIICMDQCMIDLKEVPEAALGDEVTIYGDGSDGTLSIQEVAQMTGTNKNDIVSRLTRRPPRVYVRGGKVVGVRTAVDAAVRIS